MSIISQNYSMEPDAYGLHVITRTGRCTHDERQELMDGVTSKYQMISIPHATGAVLKSMDGTTPQVVEVTPPTIPDQTFRCVKVQAFVNPMAFEQPSGPYAGKYVHRFIQRFQEVTSV